MVKSENSPVHEVHNSKVSPTAWGVAWLRTFTDIPYTKEIFEALEKQRIASGIPDFAEQMKRAHLAPQLEARYKLVDRLIKSVGAFQLLELGSGLAPRGINFALNDISVNYVDTDLPSIVDDKIKIYNQLGLQLPENLRIVAADALNENDVQAAVEYVPPDNPLVVVNEGVMRYLNFDQKTIFAQNVRTLLERFGGAWVTPDISLSEAMAREDEVAPGHIGKLQNMTSTDLSKNVFESQEHAEQFFEDLGFKVERHSFLEVSDELVSPARLGMTGAQVERLNGPCPAFVMRLA